MILALIFIFLFFGFLIILSIPKNAIKLLRLFSIILSGSVLILSCLLLSFFNKNSLDWQYFTKFELFNSKTLNLDFTFGLDGISIFFFVLTSLLIFLCIIFIWEDRFLKNYFLVLFLIEFLLLFIFSTLNLFLFYVFFEFILIPMFLLIGVWGSREKKIRAAYLLFFYTVCGSLLMLIAIFYIYTKTGTFNFEYLQFFKFTFQEQIFLWIAFFISFASKIPMFPIHIWLPEAHVEAPTVGSVLLAGILLKLGVYGFLRYSLTLFPDACVFFSPLVYSIALIGVIYASLIAIKQTDMKRVVAYSSIAHMNLVMLGVFSGNVVGVEAAIMQSISHGFVSSALFFLIGVLYSRYHSRFLYYYSGLVHVMPLYSVMMLFFILSNIALPGTSSFVGEFLLLNALFQENSFCALIAGLSVVLSGAYSLWLYNRIAFGNIKIIYTKKFLDLFPSEFFILTTLLILSLFMGVFPSYFLEFLHLSVTKLFIITNINIF